MGEPPRAVVQTFFIHCFEPSFHTFEFTSVIQVTTTGVTDPYLSENQAETSLAVAAIAQADLAIVSWDLSAAPDELLVSDGVKFSTTKIVNNFGDLIS